MKKILITGINSYIGNEFESWVNHRNYNYDIEKISVRNEQWKEEDWVDFDVVLHVAGIAHNSNDVRLKEMYYRVNRDLTIDIAKKAKNDGVKHFINMSSIIVFGTRNQEIDMTSSPNPDNFYGDSKLQAENIINELADQSFIITNIRPPMVYGKNAKGNFPLLVKLARNIPIFPNYSNKRSMIYIKNLSEFIRIVIDTRISGNLHPQNSNYVGTTDLVKLIAENNNHKVLLTRIFNPIITLLLKINLLKKVFGNLYYNSDMTDGNIKYDVFDLEQSLTDLFDSDH